LKMMKKKKKADPWLSSKPPWAGPPIALFWDQSLLWGLMCVKTLTQLKLPFRLVTSQDIREGVLDHHRVIVVPGGWAAHKVEELGPVGRNRLEHFVRHGGSYLGFCGGAGLALSSPHSLGLASLRRKKLQERLPSASGEVWIEGNAHHPAWTDLPGLLPVTVWWPSQFHGSAKDEVTCLGTYRAAGKDFMVADICVKDFETAHGEKKARAWQDMENTYGINLNPEKLLLDTAIVEVSLGKGRMILSYPHLETPEDTWGNRLCFNLLNYLDLRSGEHLSPGKASRPGPGRGQVPSVPVCPEAVPLLMKAQEMAEELIAMGERNLLWRWRNPWLLSWRRGIRGLEYGMLAISLKSAVSLARRVLREDCFPAPGPSGASFFQDLCRDVSLFHQKARLLLLEEKTASQNGGISKLSAVNSLVDDLRRELFGEKMNHGGLSRSIFDRLDRLLLELIRARESLSDEDLCA